MKRFGGLFRDTWLLWIVLLLAAVPMTMYVSPVFICTYPIVIFSFIYFGLVRYDDDGNPREM